MPDILHRIAIKSSPADAFKALATLPGLAGWWTGDTTVAFDLAQDGDHTIVLFRHRGWQDAVEFMAHCSTKWATFLISLKALVETGRSAAFPNDVHISNKGD